MIPGLLQTADYARRMIEMAYEPGNVTISMTSAPFPFRAAGA